MCVRRRSLVLWALFPICALAAQEGDSPSPARAVTSQDVVTHLERTIAWYRSVASLEPPPAVSASAMLRDNIRQKAARAVRLAFDFAKAEAVLLSDKPAAEGEAIQPPSSRMQQVNARATQRVTTLESAIRDLDSALGKSARTRPILEAQRRQLTAELELARQIQASIRALAAFSGSVAAGASDSLAARIGHLERSIPEALGAAQNPAPAAAPVSSAPPASPQPESAGIVRLVGELIALARARGDVNHLAGDTDSELDHIDQIRSPLAAELKLTIRQSDAMASAPPANNLETIRASQSVIESLGTKFRQLSAATVPLREQAILVESSRGDLTQMRQAIAVRFNTVGWYALTRTAMLVIAICIVLVISQVWRRMSFRYIRDARRRRQLLLVRRVAVTCAIALVLILTLLSEIGSLATYAGFLTAGLALALQSPILSIVAYFFLIGRYGLRVGDRVTMGGVTGEVIDIGLVRLYLMELTGAGADSHATGRIVVFSNSVIFQPSAMFKQIPGADYLWRTVRLTLAAGTDSQLAERSLMPAVESVYEEYRESIERQHAAFERSMDAKIAPPQPEGRLELSDAGLEFTARYPAERRRAPEMDDRIIKALRDAVANEPKLKLAGQGGPRLLAAV